MLPAEMANIADRTRNRARAGDKPEENPEENGEPEVVLPGEVDGDEDPLAPPPREEGETLEAYTMRLMQSVTREQLRSFRDMAQTMQEMTEQNRRPYRGNWYDSDDPDSEDSDYQDAHDRVRIKRIRKRIQAPIFKGNLGERPEPHLLRATDWFDSQGVRRDADKVYNFKHTLNGEAREWYADYIRDTGAVPTWATLINELSRYYSTQGRGMKNLHDAWRKLAFNPETDDIEEFLRDAQECARQLRHDDTAIINMLKGAMPREIYAALFSMGDLRDIIKFIKEYYSKNPAERKARQEQQEAGGVTPFKSLTEAPKPDLTTTLAQLTERLDKMDFTQKPYKPTLYPSGRGRGHGRGGRFQGRRGQGGQQSSYQPRRGRGRGNFRGKPRGQKFDKSPTKRVPRENSKTKDVDKDRCRYCREVGHWVKDCPQKKRDQDKDSSSDAFAGLNDIVQDFYGKQSTDVFHGIQEIYKDEEETPEQELEDREEEETPMSLN